MPVTLVRLALVVLALAQAALAWPALVEGEDGMPAAMHVAHEAGAWNLALAVAFLGVGLRPARAAALVPFLGAFVAMLAVVVVPDLVTGNVSPARVTTHLLVVIGLVLVIVAARADRLDPRAPVTDSAGGDMYLDGTAGAAPSPGHRPASRRTAGNRAAEDSAVETRAVGTRGVGSGAVGTGVADTAATGQLPPGSAA